MIVWFGAAITGMPDFKRQRNGADGNDEFARAVLEVVQVHNILLSHFFVFL